MKHLSQTRRPAPRTQSLICNKSGHRGAKGTRLANTGGHRLGSVLKVSLCVSYRARVTAERESHRARTPLERRPIAGSEEVHASAEAPRPGGAQSWGMPGPVGEDEAGLGLQPDPSAESDSGSVF